MLQKQSLNVNFGMGLDTKSDPYQVPAGKFLSLENSIFTDGGRLTKRNGFGSLPALPTANQTAVTTFNGNLTALGPTLKAFSEPTQSWVDRGTMQGISLNTLSLVRSNNSQIQIDTAIAANGLVCTVYTETVPAGLTPFTILKYSIADSNTGQIILAPTQINTGSIASFGGRVFLLGGYFVILFTNTIAGVAHLQYLAIPTASPLTVPTNVDISPTYGPDPALNSLPFDGAVVNGRLFIAYSDTGGGGQVKLNYLTSALALGTAITFASGPATSVSVSIDITIPSPYVIYIAIVNSSAYGGDDSGHIMASDYNLSVVFGPTSFLLFTATLQVTSSAQNGSCQIFYEIINSYGYDANVPTDYTSSVNVTSAGSVGSPYVVLRSVGLASKSFIINGVIYFLSTYVSPYQPSYYLTDLNGNVCARLAYSNGFGFYYGTGLPSVTVNNSVASLAYLLKTTISPVNKATNPPAGTQVNGIYSQVGANLVDFKFNEPSTPLPISTAEIGNNLNISGGFMWMYDGTTPVEQNFNYWPDSIEVTGSPIAGGLVESVSANPEIYYYQVVYEWTDNQGNAFFSAPSIPVTFQVLVPGGTFTGNRTSSSPILTSISSFAGLQVGQAISGTGIPANTFILSLDTIGSTLTMTKNAASGSATSTVVTPVQVTSALINVPTLRLTYKIANPVKITIFRWSTSQQIYYQVTPVIGVIETAPPLLNDPTVDYVTWTDSLSSADILGNSIIYTNGGVVEDICPPATDTMALFDDRLWLVDSEDRNLLWYSKQIIEDTPVEMSDLFTFYVAPTLAALGSTGPITAIYAMDDKLVVFKKNAIYYINGTGPDNTGANSQYSQPVYVASTVGCSNQQSIVLTPQGLMFQSDKGIWLLGRDLSTNYIGAPVEEFNSSSITSATTVPGQNQVRFTISSGTTLMYDYFYEQWGTFINVPAVSSTLYNSLHTYIDSSGNVFQETPGLYLDGTNPVLMSFITSWLNLANFQSYQRAYFFYILGTYYTPHKLNFQIAYDFNSTPTQDVVISPINYSSNLGVSGTLENWRIFLQKQRCQSFQIQFNETYDASFGIPAGQGLSISGLNIIIGAKKSFRPISNAESAGRS